MPSLNKVFLMGNVTRDPEVRYTPGGTAVADIGLAINETYRNKAGEQVERTCFVDVVTWGRQAETCRDYLSKGSPIMVEGSLEFDQWETQQGEKRSKLRVRAMRVQFLGSPRRSAAGSPEEPEPDGSPPPRPAGRAGGATDGPAEDNENLPF